jgi:oligopeptide transport system substrate-binding protein
MSVHTTRTLLLASLVLVVLVAAACGNGDGNDDASTRPSAEATATSTQAQRATITPRNNDTSQPVMTSPIDLAPAGFLTYINEEQGFAFHHPEDWSPAPIPSGSSAEVSIQGPGGSPQIAVYRTLEIENLSDSERMDALIEVFTQILDDVVEVDAHEATIHADGKALLRVDLRFASGTSTMRLQIVSRGLRTYLTTVRGTPEVFDSNSGLLTTLLNSFVAFDPTPFGIARDRALTMPGSDPVTLDPAMSRETRSNLIVAHLFSGLVRFDEELRVQLDLAENVSVDLSDTVYTFTLRDDIAFHDGTPITAEDFAYSLERAADANLHSATAALYLGDIVGVKEKLAGSADSISGLEIVNARTVRLTIDEPKAYFLAKLTYPTAYIVDSDTVEPRGPEWWKGRINGSGPFKLERWTEGEVLVLQRFDDYPAVSSLEYAIFPINQGLPMQMYEAGLVDVAFIGGASVDRALDPVNDLSEQLRVFPQFNTDYIGFNMQKPPFDDPTVRRAFAMALDRDEFVEVIYDNDVQVAQGLLPPGFPGYDDSLDGIPFDPQAAKALLAKSEYAGDAFPEVIYTTSGLGGIPANVQFIVDSWKTVLGVEVQVRALAPDAYFYQLSDELDNLFDYGWIADYPDPENFLDVLLHSESLENNIGHYNNPEYDRLLETARSEEDTPTRMALYNEAERLLLVDTAIIPLFHKPDYILTKPNVDGFIMGPLGVPLLQNVRINPR